MIKRRLLLLISSKKKRRDYFLPESDNQISKNCNNFERKIALQPATVHFSLLVVQKKTKTLKLDLWYVTVGSWWDEKTKCFFFAVYQ